jgi:predicted Zn-dependent protease
MALRRLVFGAAVLILAWTAAAFSAPGPARRPAKGMVAVFLPIGASPERVAAVAENFRTELSLETAVLPPMEPESSATDQRRKQLVGERLIQQIHTAHRQLLSHGKVVLIGITERDMLTSAQAKAPRSPRANQTSSFALSVRNTSSSIAVVSTFRMDPRNLGAGINDDVLQSRLRKIVAKHVGLMLYGLPASKDPHSLLFSGISGVEQLDFIDARFANSGLLAAQ